MNAMFHVGQKVVCVDASENPKPCRWQPGEAVVEGRIYTIRKVFENRFGPSVLLDEVARSPAACAHYGIELGYGTHRFRPVVERKTDISIFTAMLTPNKAKERA